MHGTLSDQQTWWRMVAGACNKKGRSVDGKNPANQLRLVVYPIIYKDLYIPGGAGFLPSTVSPVHFSMETLILEKKRENYTYEN